MITKVEVNDFQSVEKAEIELGQITTIVGPSSTGKSALLRAVNMLFRNMSSVPVRAQSSSGTTTVSALVDDKTITAIRGKSLSTYKVNDIAYTKSGVSVPEKVQNILGLYQASPDLHFSFQFDKPYLLDESGSIISQTLGTLTQASTLRGAAKEGNRRALEVKRLITTRQNDMKSVDERLEEDFNGLEQAWQRQKEAEALYEASVSDSERLSALSRAVARVESTQAAREALCVVEAKDARSILEELETHISVYSSILTSLDAIAYAQKIMADVPSKKDATQEINSIEKYITDLKNTNVTLDKVTDGALSYEAAQRALEVAQKTLNQTNAAIDLVVSNLPTCSECGQVIPS